MKKSKSLQIFFIVVLLFSFMAVPVVKPHAAQNGSVLEHYKDNSKKDSVPNKSDADANGLQEEPASKSLGFFSYLKVLFALVLVLGLLIAVLKFLNKRNVQYQQNNVVRNIGGITVGPQKSVQLIQVGERIYMIGVGEDVQLLKELSNEAEIEGILSHYEDKQTMSSSVPYVLEKFSKMAKKKPETTTQNFDSVFKTKLTEIKKERTEGLEQWKGKERDKL